MLRTLKLKIQITYKKAQVLDHMGYIATKLWNTANWERKDQWNKTGLIPTYAEQAGQLKTNQWYKQLPSQTAQAVLEKLEQGYQSWYILRKNDPKARPPGFRSKHTLSSIVFKKSAFKVQGKLIRLSLAKSLREKLAYPDHYLWLPFKSSKEVAGEPRVLELKNINGRWVGYRTVH